MEKTRLNFTAHLGNRASNVWFAIFIEVFESDVRDAADTLQRPQRLNPPSNGPIPNRGAIKLLFERLHSAIPDRLPREMTLRERVAAELRDQLVAAQLRKIRHVERRLRFRFHAPDAAAGFVA
ncbi:MAG TPA: hypothetical protein VEO95_12190, partial [Chthoniobacteraceae bacterium]|nr:hypothetical protein [Chthoniobacteraceae bacterium]